jgi:CubicO group peptidase (beta-lactamase class C family)
MWGVGVWALAALPLYGQEWAAVEAAVAQGIASNLFPGAVVVIGRTDTILYAKGYGRFTWDTRSRRPEPDSTLWDLASLTKVMATASAALRLWDRGMLDLEAPVSRYLPEFTGGGREQVTVRMLLDHSSGLRAWAPLWREQRTRDGAVHALLRETPTRPPGSTTRYSDLNAMLLGLVLEQVAGARLDVVAHREVFEPLGMANTQFRVPPRDWPRTAPSRLDRGRATGGTVNDDNARRLLGVAGHAGLFSTGMDVARFAQVWLALVRGREGSWVSAARARRFLERTPGFRPLGWAMADTTVDRGAFGTMATEAIIGHTGWTGTSLWLDPDRDLFVVLLTNRAISPRGNGSLEPMRLVRAEVSDAARRAVGALCLEARGAPC